MQCQSDVSFRVHDAYLIVEFPVAVPLLPKPIVVVMEELLEVVALMEAELVEVLFASTSENWPL